MGAWAPLLLLLLLLLPKTASIMIVILGSLLLKTMGFVPRLKLCAALEPVELLPGRARRAPRNLRERQVAAACCDGLERYAGFPGIRHVVCSTASSHQAGRAWAGRDISLLRVTAAAVDTTTTSSSSSSSTSSSTSNTSDAVRESGKVRSVCRWGL